MNNAPENKTVLVVDDYFVVCNLLKRYLSEYRFNVITCSNGADGIKTAVKVKPDLIFLDLLMPDIDGIKMLNVVRSTELLKPVPVVVISANTNRTNVLSAIEAGADRVISKPLRKEIILKTVRELLGVDLNIPGEMKISSLDDFNMVQELRRDFIAYFKSKKNEFFSALEGKSRDSLKGIIHNIKGVGVTIGCPQLTSISTELQDDLLNQEVDWTYIKVKCGKILSLVSEIENGQGI
jgi:CheY-like chemotaxis protein